MTARTPCAVCISDHVMRARFGGRCTVCAGDGFLDEVGPPRCWECGGDGWVVEGHYEHASQEPCPVCSGTGIGSQWLPPTHRHALVCSGASGGVVYDRDDQPRLLGDVRDADALPEWWALHRVEHINGVVVETLEVWDWDDSSEGEPTREVEAWEAGDYDPPITSTGPRR